MCGGDARPPLSSASGGGRQGGEARKDEWGGHGGQRIGALN